MKGYAASPSALQRVVDVFDEHDITLHIDAKNCFINFPDDDELSESNELPHIPRVDEEYDNDSYWKKTMDSNFDRKRKDIFRYCIYINSFESLGTLGISNGIPGNSFISAKGRIGSNEIAEAVNFMHELGHTLGLTHGGAKDDHFCYKPNHLSIMNYLYSCTGVFDGLYPTHEINYSEYELPEIDINHVDERKGIDPEGIVDDSLGCIWCIYNNGEIKYDEEESINEKAIDFNRNEIFEKDIKEDLFFYIDTTNGIRRGTKAKATINEWDNLIYKPEENSMVVRNKFEVKNNGDEFYDIPLELLGPPMVLLVDTPNRYEFDGVLVYNEKDGKYYYRIGLINLGRSSTIADISTDSSELKFNLTNFKVELPMHNNETMSIVNVFIPVEDNLDEKDYRMPIMIRYYDGTKEVINGSIALECGYEYYINEIKVNDELSQKNATIKYSICDFSRGPFVTTNGKNYTLPCEAYQKEDGTWTSDAVDNFEEYVDQVVEKVDVKGFVNTQDFSDNTNSIHKNVLYVIGFIVLVGIVLLLRFVLKVIKNKQEEDY